MLLKKNVAGEFLARYKTVLTEINGGDVPINIESWIRCRDDLHNNKDKIRKLVSASDDFKNALQRSVYGRFIFLKRYKSWYAFHHIKKKKYYALFALTDPIEMMVCEFSVIKTALVPYANAIVCDGLIADERFSLGPNYTKFYRSGYWEAKRLNRLIVNL